MNKNQLTQKNRQTHEGIEAELAATEEPVSQLFLIFESHLTEISHYLEA